MYRFLCGFLPCPPGSYRNHDRHLQHRSMYKPWSSPVSRTCLGRESCKQSLLQLPGRWLCKEELLRDHGKPSAAFSCQKLHEGVGCPECMFPTQVRDRQRRCINTSNNPASPTPENISDSLTSSLCQPIQPSRALHWTEHVNGIPYAQRRPWASVKCFTPVVVCRPGWDT